MATLHVPYLNALPTHGTDSSSLPKCRKHLVNSLPSFFVQVFSVLRFMSEFSDTLGIMFKAAFQVMNCSLQPSNTS